MSMTSLNVSLPQALKDYVEEQVQQGGYSTPSEYVRALLREDQKRCAEAKLEALLLEGIHSGEPIEVNKEFWKKRRQKLLALHAAKKRGK